MPASIANDGPRGIMTKAAGNTVVDYTIEVLRDAIRTGRFVPGQRLIVADITQEFSVSAGPVREAIRRLTGEGLIEIIPHRGASVRQIGAKDLREIYQLREAIEGAAARLAAGNDDPAYRAAMIAVREEMDEIVTSAQTDRFLDNNRHFHDLVYRMAGNEMMRQLALQLILPIYQLRLPNRMGAEELHVSYGGHQRIIAAILGGNAAAAEQAMRDHVAESGRGLIAALETVEAARGARRRRSPANSA